MCRTVGVQPWTTSSPASVQLPLPLKSIPASTMAPLTRPVDDEADVGGKAGGQDGNRHAVLVVDAVRVVAVGTHARSGRRPRDPEARCQGRGRRCRVPPVVGQQRRVGAWRLSKSHRHDVIMKLPAAVWLIASVATQFTVVVPMGNVLPGADCRQPSLVKRRRWRRPHSTPRPRPNWRPER